MSKEKEAGINELSSEFSEIINKKVFEESDEKQEAIKNRIESIRLVTEQLKEKYSNRQEFISFIDYLATLEKTFVAIELRGKDSAEIKKSFLDIEEDLAGKTLGIEVAMRSQIIEKFRQSHNNVTGIIMTAERLEKKYFDDKKISGFIEYIKMSLIEFLDAIDNPNAIDDRKTKVIEARMRELSANGDPRLEELKKVYEEFKNELTKLKKNKENEK